MRNPEKTLDQISGSLIDYLRDELRNPTIDYEIPLTQLQGGYQTYTYRFRLSGVEQELAKPLVLRLNPQFYGTGNAIWESTIQNMLADEGYPVSRVHLTCTDMSVLGGAFFIMEFLEGESLSAMLKRTGPIDLPAACGILEPALLALAAAHEKGISTGI